MATPSVGEKRGFGSMAAPRPQSSRLRTQQLLAEEDQVMFNPGEKNEAHGDLDSMLREEEKVGGMRRVFATQDMDWDNSPWGGMEWEEAETRFPAPILWEGEVCPIPSRGGEVVCSAPVCGGKVMYKSSFSGEGVVCPFYII